LRKALPTDPIPARPLEHDYEDLLETARRFLAELKR
jgi:hypothetical protein